MKFLISNSKFLILHAAFVGFACLAASCRTAKPTTSAQSQLTHTHSTALRGVEWQGWQRILSCDSLIFLALPEEFAQEETNPSDSTRLPISPATLATQKHCGARVTNEKGRTIPLNTEGATIKVYGLHLSEISKTHSTITTQTSDSLDTSWQTKSQAVSTQGKAHRASWPLPVAIITIIVIATAITYFARKHQ